MEYHGVKIIDIDPPMRDDPPPSDALIARQLAVIQEKLLILKEDGAGLEATYQITTVREKLERRLNRLVREHSAHQAAFAEWIRQGKPTLKGKGVR